MKLLLDIGNSSVNWAIQEHDDFTRYGAFSYKQDHFAEDLQENPDHSVRPVERRSCVLSVHGRNQGIGLHDHRYQAQKRNGADSVQAGNPAFTLCAILDRRNCFAQRL